MEALLAVDLVPLALKTVQSVYEAVSKRAMASESTEKIADDPQDFRFEGYALQKKAYAIKQIANDLQDFRSDVEALKKTLDAVKQLCTEYLHADGTYFQQSRFDSGTLRERIEDTLENERISTQHHDTARKSTSYARPMSTRGHFYMLDRDSVRSRHSSSNRDFTSDQTDMASHARFIHLDTEFAVDTLALAKQRVPIKTVGLPEGNIHLQLPWTLVIDALDECPDKIPIHHTSPTYLPGRYIQLYSTDQHQQCCLKSIPNKPFNTSIRWKMDNAAVAEDVRPVRRLSLHLLVELEGFEGLAFYGTANYHPVLIKREGLAIYGTANYQQKLAQGWKSSLLRPMQPYETGKERFATKIREAVLDLRRPQSALTRLIRRVRRALSTPLSWQIAFFSPILLAPSVGAVALDQPGKIQINALSYDYWSKVLHVVRTDILSLLIDPHSKQSSRTLSTSDPQTLLLVCFICTGSLALITQARRKDIWQPYIVALCTLIATFIGAMRTVDSRVFIFGYLFWGCAIGTGGSAIFHHVKNSYARESKPE